LANGVGYFLAVRRLLYYCHAVLVASNAGNWRALWKNWICSTTIKLRKLLVKSVTRQKTCNYNELFSSSARDRHAGRILCYSLNVCRYMHRAW